MTPEELDAIEARANAATKWSPKKCDLRCDPEDGRAYAPQGATLGNTMIQLADTYDGSDRDWVFLAHVRTDVPDLIAEVRRLTAERDAAFTRGVEVMREAAAKACESHWRGCERESARVLADVANDIRALKVSP